MKDATTSDTVIKAKSPCEARQVLNRVLIEYEDSNQAKSSAKI